ncbi:hypothetical protein LJ737_20735 [Hymenobacter sp. 15J16-1T3B]|uniref:hypothetical protein n=1 Tax=Hymenobacter sp. 15J16-1T3B TaxID=2886941 RepID=UPI001D12FE99|nr:hypothetical protein [Hymenobacter sp. 15J16-1T3B]MCC3159680.1 hypothetical protein [Hymenobacter sp. 15J16-1T3B]
MQDALAEVFAARLRPLPFLDALRVPGLVRPYEWDAKIDQGVERHRAPVPAKLPEAICDKSVEFLRPRENRKGLVIFEDGGVVDGPRPGANYPAPRVATLTLRAWVNQAKAAEPLTDGELMQAVRQALLANNGQTAGSFGALRVKLQELPADARLWTPYSGYDGPLLYPPYQLLGLVLTCTYYPVRCQQPTESLSVVVLNQLVGGLLLSAA